MINGGLRSRIYCVLNVDNFGEKRKSMSMSLSFLAGPIVGAVIGYFTNYLAVKMLFRPRKAIKIGSWTLPLTPGVIPKGKARLAKAVGNAVSENLLTQEDMSQHLLNEDTTNVVVDRAVNLLNCDVKESVITLTGTSEGRYEARKDKVVSAISDYLTDQVQKLPLKEKFTEVIVEASQEKLNQLAMEGGMMSMVAMMLPEEKIRELAEPMGWKAEKFIEDHAYEYIQPVFQEKLGELERECPMDILNSMDLDDKKIRKLIERLYRSVINENIAKVMSHLNIASVIETKINDMSVEELEKLVLSVMKNELNMIVSLGAVIGFVIGFINVFI